MIFADTSFWIASADARDSRHDDAGDLWRASGSQGIVTSNHVLGETWTYLTNRQGHEVATRAIDRILAIPRLRPAFADKALEEQAWAWLRGRDDRPYSFVDATSFALMRSLRIREALTFDEDFAAAGFVVLQP